MKTMSASWLAESVACGPAHGTDEDDEAVAGKTQAGSHGLRALAGLGLLLERLQRAGGRVRG